MKNKEITEGISNRDESYYKKFLTVWQCSFDNMFNVKF